MIKYRLDGFAQLDKGTPLVLTETAEVVEHLETTREFDGLRFHRDWGFNCPIREVYRPCLLIRCKSL
jgi:hypothetical protein